MPWWKTMFGWLSNSESEKARHEHDWVLQSSTTDGLGPTRNVYACRCGERKTEVTR